MAVLTGGTAIAHVKPSQASLQTSPAAQRQLDPQRFLRALEGRPKAPVQILVLKADAEALQLARQFQRLLQLATWKVLGLEAVDPGDLARLANRYSSTADDQLIGVVVTVRAESQREFALFEDREANTPLNALLEAILETLGNVNTYASSPSLFPAPPRNTLRLVVGPNPQSSGIDP